MNLIYFLDGALDDALVPVMTLLGYVIFVIKVLVPVILVIVGMYDLSQAILKKDEEDIKKAQKLLVKKLIAGVCVFLVISIVTLVMDTVITDKPGQNTWRSATHCAFDPFDSKCKLIVEP